MLKNGGIIVTDREWSQHPSALTTEGKNEELRALIPDNCRVAVDEVATVVLLPIESSNTDLISVKFVQSC